MHDLLVIKYIRSCDKDLKILGIKEKSFTQKMILYSLFTVIFL